MNPLGIVLIIIGVAVVILLIIKAAQIAAARERARIASLGEWAHRNSFTFHQQDPFNLESRFNGVGDIGRGHARYGFEVLHREDPAPSWIFRYHFKTWETRVVTTTDSEGRSHTRTETYEETHWRAYVIIELRAEFPEFSIRTESWLDRVAGFVGFDDIDFESEEFSKKYFVKSSDRQFAYALVHPQMMEWLLTTRFAAQIVGRLFIMDLSAIRYDAPGVDAAWRQAAGFINRIPPFVWQDYGKVERIELPATRVGV